MAAPQIPNLLDSLRNSRGSRGGTGLRGRGRAPGPGSSTDTVIQQTDDDAAGSRMSAVEVGYLVDPFARPMTHSQQSTRRMPIINRGTYVRTVAIDALVKKFLAAYEKRPVQIVSLGAGTDTRPFRLLQNDRSLSEKLTYHEIDFAACTSRKTSTIASAKLLDDIKLNVSQDGTRISSTAYNLHPFDLRELALTAGAAAERSETQLPNLNSSQPTLILSECCLTYVNTSTSVSILRHLLNTLVPPTTPVSVILYEPLHPDDAFGKTMTSNLSARGISLPGVIACPTLHAHQQRLLDCGFERADGMLVKDWWRTEVTDDEKERLRRLEGLDEEEEWDLLAGHYGFIWASRGEGEWP